MKIRTLTEKDVVFTIEVLPEIDGPEGHFGYDTEEENQETIAYIRAQMEWNQWAWCCVKVTATFGNFTGVDYLGACSYASQKDFEECGYFEDMKSEALRDLNNTIANTARKLEGLTQ